MRAIQTLLLSGFLLLAVSASLLGQDLTGTWLGKYNYPAGSGRAAVNFRLVFVQEGSEVFGFVKEPNTFGKAGVTWLHAVIQGRVDQAGELSFTKTYDGTGDQIHSVKYRGRIGENGTRVQGSWSIEGSLGADFSMQRDHKPSGEKSPLVGVWAGSYAYPKEVTGIPNVDFWMVVVPSASGVAGLIKEPNSFGTGTDPWLHASLAGSSTDSMNPFSFAKKYDGTGQVDHEVKYQGRFANGVTEISGDWIIPDSWSGKFSAKKVGVGGWGKLKLNEARRVTKVRLPAPPRR